MKLRESLAYEPAELSFGTSGLRGLVTDMTDLECYINAAGFLEFLEKEEGLQKGATIYIAGDLRDSTPRITNAVATAIIDRGYEVQDAGKVPTPAVAYYAQTKNAPCIMVTGSHIPADRNGIKFYKASGEVLKSDEQPIKAAVATVRTRLYTQDTEQSKFDEQGMFRDSSVAQVTAVSEATLVYTERYTKFFQSDYLAGKKVIVYQHSAVGRDMLADVLKQFGAEVVTVGRSDSFVPIDSENVTPKDQAYFRQLATEHPGLFAIVSTDGDSDRPFVVDETGQFHRGDVLGAVVAMWLAADHAAYPVSSSDAVDEALQAAGVQCTHTKIGSPYVIEAMSQASATSAKTVVGWEVNGGLMVDSEITIEGHRLDRLPTRDAFLPIFAALASAVQQNKSVSEIFVALPKRFTGAGLIDNFPSDTSKLMIQKFSEDTEAAQRELARYFTLEKGFSAIKSINTLDGVRIYFENADIAHLRPSGNAPQLRIYSVADTQERADEIVTLALIEPDGILRQIEKLLT